MNKWLNSISICMLFFLINGCMYEPDYPILTENKGDRIKEIEGIWQLEFISGKGFCISNGRVYEAVTSENMANTYDGTYNVKKPIGWDIHKISPGKYELKWVDVDLNKKISEICEAEIKILDAERIKLTIKTHKISDSKKNEMILYKTSKILTANIQKNNSSDIGDISQFSSKFIEQYLPMGARQKQSMISPGAEFGLFKVAPTFNFKGEKIILIPKIPLQVYGVYLKKKEYIYGIRKNWSNKENIEYRTEIECPVGLVIEYGTGDWTRFDMDETTKLFIRNGIISVKGQVILSSAKTFIYAKKILVNNTLLINRNMLKNGSNYDERLNSRKDIVKDGMDLIVNADNLKKGLEIYFSGTKFQLYTQN